MIGVEQCDSELKRLGLEKYAPELRAIARPALQITRQPSNDTRIPLGASKLGGDPDLPEDVVWPAWNEMPLAFLGQIDLSDVAPFQAGTVLPESGLLSFFYSDETPWGFDPADKGGWSVMYHDASVALRRLKSRGPAYPVEPSGLSFREWMTFPTYMGWDPREPLKDDWDAREAGFSVDAHDVDRLIDLYRDEGPPPYHRLLGYPTVVQNPMELECQLASHGIYMGGGWDPGSDEIKALVPGADDWRLLLQLDSDGDAMWGDSGMIYFWIPRQALAARRFDESWLILQCG